MTPTMQAQLGNIVTRCVGADKRGACAPVIARRGKPLLPSRMRKNTVSLLLTATLATALMAACSPKFDWRDYRSKDAPYAVLFPGKPASQTRTIDLDGQQVSMTMTAAEIDGVAFAVGSAELADTAHAQTALLAMKSAMIKNIDGKIVSDTVAAASSGQGIVPGQQTSIDVEAQGTQQGQPMLLIGHFVAKDKRIYQAIVVGREKNVVREEVDTFISSFKLD